MKTSFNSQIGLNYEQHVYRKHEPCLGIEGPVMGQWTGVNQFYLVKWRLESSEHSLQDLLLQQMHSNSVHISSHCISK